MGKKIIVKNNPDLKYKCKCIFLTQATSQKDGNLKISDVSLPADNHVSESRDWVK